MDVSHWERRDEAVVYEMTFDDDAAAVRFIQRVAEEIVDAHLFAELWLLDANRVRVAVTAS
jgi:pterin-4a-carbinolamine dehydratase